MIGKVMRGRNVGGLLRYLYGPGRANEHTAPHLVASWDDNPAGLEPAVDADGRLDVRTLARLLEQPLSAAVRPSDRPVWHCAVRTAPSDRLLSDKEWRDVARDILARTRLAPDGDDSGCRWAAVRHADDHIHIVVTLARQDGTPARTSNDFYRVGEACRAAETRLGLTRTAPRDRTAPRRPSRGESEKAVRAGRREPARLTLQREVRTAAAGAASAEEFLARLADAGLLVRPRFSEHDADILTGYSVALPGDRAGDGRTVWFGGGRLAADLSWPKLASRWGVGHDSGRDNDAGQRRPRRVRLTGAERAAVWRDAATTATAAANDVRRLSATDPAAASDIAHAAGRALAATARVVEGRTGGPLTEAADQYDRAARELHGRLPAATRTGTSLRSVARLLALTGRAARDETTQVLALVANLADLADAVAELRAVQERSAQSVAARAAADQLLAASSPPGSPAGARSGRPAPSPTVVVHRSRALSSVHSQPPHPRRNEPRRRTVQP